MWIMSEAEPWLTRVVASRRLSTTAEQERLRTFRESRALEPVEAVALLAGVTFFWLAVCIVPSGLVWRATSAAQVLSVAFMVLFLAGFACIFIVSFSVHVRILGFRSLSLGRAESLRRALFSPSCVRAAAVGFGWSDRAFAFWWKALLVSGVCAVVVPGLCMLLVG
jgi:hypothetical protein